jgi:Fic family protein
MHEFKAHLWAPIDDLPNNWERLRDESIHALAKQWQSQEISLRQRKSFQEFNRRLNRQWAIETGAIEQIYSISDGATRTLIEHGLHAALLAHGDTDIDTDLAVARIVDQHNAIEAVYQFIAQERPLNKTFLRQLHDVLTAHQDTVDAIDGLGAEVKRPLIRGNWKTLPNNVRGPDGQLFAFCPPESVESEVDRLLAMHSEHLRLGVSPLVEAAWFHHRFTLIHPFQDGNGRMARALASLILLQGRWMPLLVTREDKGGYIEALRRADDGDLMPLVARFGSLQQRVIVHAISSAEDAVMETVRMAGVMDLVKDKIRRRVHAMSQAMALARAVADILQGIAFAQMREVAKELDGLIKTARKSNKAWAYQGRNNDEEKSGYFQLQIVESARQQGYFANRRDYRAWSCLAIQMDSRAEILVHLHGVGPDGAGMFGASACTWSKSTSGDDGGSSVVTAIGEHFVFAAPEDGNNVQQRFSRWMEVVLAEAVARWQAEAL